MVLRWSLQLQFLIESILNLFWIYWPRRYHATKQEHWLSFGCWAPASNTSHQGRKCGFGPSFGPSSWFAFDQSGPFFPPKRTRKKAVRPPKGNKTRQNKELLGLFSIPNRVSFWLEAKVHLSSLACLRLHIHHLYRCIMLHNYTSYFAAPCPLSCTSPRLSLWKKNRVPLLSRSLSTISYHLGRGASKYHFRLEECHKIGCKGTIHPNIVWKKWPLLKPKKTCVSWCWNYHIRQILGPSFWPMILQPPSQCPLHAKLDPFCTAVPCTDLRYWRSARELLN